MKTTPTLAWMLLVLAAATNAPAAEPASQNALPALGKQAIANKLDHLLRDLGDLQAYIDHIDNGIIVVKDFSPAPESASPPPRCASLPPPTLMKQGVDNEKLEQLERALEIFNQLLETNPTPTLQSLEGACTSHPDVQGTTLPELTPPQIAQQMTAVLARMADLSAYLVPASQDGQVAIKRFPAHPKCAMLPPPATPGKPIPKDAFTPLENAIGVLDTARLAKSRGSIPMKTVPAKCLPAQAAETR